ncbi:type II toxin-antitoxin system CcdA family antitoxin [Azospirillum sp.]|uniref:type II toxin-antitoxin system CcdA family antitoxin n=1 Tax=Azospirillum sp. TaxID=34012 RepID=UPI003D7442D0
MIGYNVHAPKRSANLSVNEDLLRQAKELGINLSATLEAELARIVREEQKRRLEAELAPTIRAWNAFHAEHGSAADDYLDL